VVHDTIVRVGVFDLHPFGLSVAAGIVVGYLVALGFALRARLAARYLPGMLVVVVLGALIIARLGFVAWRRGAAGAGAQGILSLYGLNLPVGVIGGTLLLAVYTWARREPLWLWADALAPAGAIGLAIGMLGLPSNGEGWGRPTAGPFSIGVDVTLLPQEFVNSRRFQPVFAYETALFAALAILLVVLFERQRRLGRPPTGVVGLVFLLVTMLGYGALRPLTLDAADPALVLQTQILCAAVAAIACGLLVARLWRARAGVEITRQTERVRVGSV